ncbi:tandem-type lipoprotein [Staphylococcus simulans]|uniref:tandem-type lipoprotein n=1 Tax=Staphylococcus simulans TaxID=1286 RepID=UPI003F7E76A3
MKRSKIVIVCTSFLILAIIIGGYVIIVKENNKETEIKKSFEKTLSMYPIKNLEDLYDKEGYRDEEFEKGDKGTWILQNYMTVRKKDKNLETRGMVLFFNRNNKQATGKFYINKYGGNRKYDKEEYPVELINHKIVLKNRISDKHLEEEIKNFKFFSQYANFKNIEEYKNGKISTNFNVPSYEAEYQLDNSDSNVKKIRKFYSVPTKNAPIIKMKSIGKLNESSIGYKKIEYIFSQSKDENIMFSDFISFEPSKGE